MRQALSPTRRPAQASAQPETSTRPGAGTRPDLSARGTRMRALAQLMQEGPAATDQRVRLARAFGAPATRPIPARTAPVAQRGVLYDAVKLSAENDADAADYNFTSVTGPDVIAAAEEIVAEYLASQPVGQKFEAGPGVALPAPQVQLSTGYGGVEGILLTPPRDKLALQIYTGEFLANITHELGHMVKGKTGDARVRDRIPQIAAAAADEAVNHPDAHPKPAGWVEESRADLTGLFIRFSNGIIPAKADYNQLAGEPADGEHPPGDYRLQLMATFMGELGHPW